MTTPFIVDLIEFILLAVKNKNVDMYASPEARELVLPPYFSTYLRSSLTIWCDHDELYILYGDNGEVRSPHFFRNARSLWAHDGWTISFMQIFSSEMITLAGTTYPYIPRLEEKTNPLCLHPRHRHQDRKAQ